MPDENKNTIKLPQICCKALQECLGGPGWANEPIDIVVAGTIDLEGRLDTGAMPTTQEEAVAWRDVEKEVSFSTKERAVIKKCVDFSSRKGILLPNKYSAILVSTFLELEG